MTMLISIHKDLVESFANKPANEKEMLLWMALMHTHQIEPSEPFADVPTVKVAEPLSQRAAATVIAEFWPEHSDRERKSYVYWYRRYQQDLCYEKMAEVPAIESAEIEKLRKKIAHDPRVKAIIPI